MTRRVVQKSRREGASLALRRLAAAMPIGIEGVKLDAVQERINGSVNPLIPTLPAFPVVFFDEGTLIDEAHWNKLIGKVEETGLAGVDFTATAAQQRATDDRFKHRAYTMPLPSSPLTDALDREISRLASDAARQTQQREINKAMRKMLDDVWGKVGITDAMRDAALFGTGLVAEPSVVEPDELAAYLELFYGSPRPAKAPAKSSASDRVRRLADRAEATSEKRRRQAEVSARQMEALDVR